MFQVFILLVNSSFNSHSELKTTVENNPAAVVFMVRIFRIYSLRDL